MKKIKYGNKSKSKPHQNNLQLLKDGDDDICGAVLDTLSDDYLRYISNMVKVSKTPPKKKQKQSQQQKINQLFQSNQNSQRQYQSGLQLQFQNQHQIQFQDLNKKELTIQLKEGSQKRSKSIPQLQVQNQLDVDMKNRTKRFKIRQSSQNGKIPSTLMKMKLDQNSKYKIIDNLYQRYDRKVTQPAVPQKHSQTSIIMKKQNYKNLNQRDQSRQKSSHFILNLDQYLINLQSNPIYMKQKNKNKIKNEKLKYKNHNQQFLQQEQDYEEIKIQNLKLKKKIRQYQAKTKDFQQTITQHFNYCKNRDKNNKEKIKQLVKALAQALSKINQQKDQIQTMKSLFKTFGRKVQQYSRYQDDSSVQLQQQINKSLKKALNQKPFRAKSQNRIKKHKRNLNSTLRRLQQDKFIKH